MGHLESTIAKEEPARPQENFEQRGQAEGEAVVRLLVARADIDMDQGRRPLAVTVDEARERLEDVAHHEMIVGRNAVGMSRGRTLEDIDLAARQLAPEVIVGAPVPE